jgi:outer membrane protein assembly factor BamB
VPTRGATSQTITRAAIAVLLSATLVADQSAPAAPPPAVPGYAEAWRVPLETGGPFSLAVDQTAVFVANEYSCARYLVIRVFVWQAAMSPLQCGESEQDGIAAYAKADGKLLWKHPRAGVTQLLASSAAHAPLAAVSTTDLIALDPGTGDVRWTTTLAGPADRTYLAAFQGGGLTVASGSTLRAYRRDGTVAWSVSLPAAATTPAVERDGVAWVGTDAPSLVRIDLSSGAVVSQTPVASPPQAIVVVSGEAYVGGSAPILALYRAGETKPSWQWKPKRGLAGLVGAPVVGEELVFVTALDNTLQAFDRGGGAVRWRQPLPSRPAPGLIESGGLLFVPLITGEVVRLSPVKGAKAPFAEMKLDKDARLRAFQMDAAGGVFTVTVSARTQALTSWRPAAPAKSPQPPSPRRPGA